MSRTLGAYLVEIGALDRAGLDLALAVMKRNGRRLDEVLRMQRLVPSVVVAQALAHLARYPYVEPDKAQRTALWEEAVGALGEPWCRQFAVAPCLLAGQETFLLAYPFHLPEIDRLHQRWPTASYGVTSAETIASLLSLSATPHEREITESLQAVESRGVESGHVPNVIRALINLALERRASDLHIEPSRDTVVVRCRVDGLLEPLHAIHRRYYMNVVNVLWEWAQLPHGATMELHDGHFHHDTPAGEIDVRLSAIPGQYGPAIVLRLLDQRRSSVQLEDLGYSPSREKVIGQLLLVPYGLLLVTGPTGSGKTTTLYAIINALNSQHLKVVTVEDPVEVHLPCVQQVAIHESMGTTFGSVTRAFLRHDPDIVMIGEIRDHETAREAIRAALTGRKVLSTLHTQDSVGAIPRLLELGVEPGLLAETLTGVVAQRLVRLRCRVCAPDAVDAGNADCPACHGTGEAGRTVISEVLAVNRELRNVIERRPSIEDIRALAEREGFSTLADDALALVGTGRITLEEAERILGPLSVPPNAFRPVGRPS
jgi:type II secretory ATPase GspE/PulE/Tfp pilus assembly ATPase PilB-like protein